MNRVLLLSCAILIACSSSTSPSTDVASVDGSGNEVVTGEVLAPDVTTSDAPEGSDVVTPFPWPTCPTGNEGPTLAEKAAYLDELMVAQHLADGLLRTVTVDDDGEVVAYHHLPSTGLWTAMYLASQSLRYAVTGDPVAQQNAGIAVQGLHDLSAVTGSSGLYGRAYARPDFEYAYDVSESPAWTASPAVGYEGWYFNHDVSKDTMDGIAFGYSVALEHLDDEAILEIVRTDFKAFVDHLVGNGLQIIDHTGVVTEHGRLYYSAMDDFPGFNALLVAGWLRPIMAAVPDPELDHFYYDCLMRLGPVDDCPDIETVDLGSYMEAIEKTLSLYMDNCQTNYDHFDMVLQALYPLMRFETDPGLLDRLADVLEVGVWETGDPSLDQPLYESTHSLYIYMYGGLADPATDDAVFRKALEDSACSMVALPQHRAQHAVAAGTQETACLNRHGKPNAAEIVPLLERNFDNYVWRFDPREIPEEQAANPYHIHSADDYLSAYWLGRYHGYISPEM
jgi:hypothetical protein